ncbi:alpha/beta hydrolase [Halomonas sp. KM007]
MVIENKFNILVDAHRGHRICVREFVEDEVVDIRKPPLLLVHGATIASELWVNDDRKRSWCHQLAERGFNVFTFDFLGFRESSVDEYENLSILDTRSYKSADHLNSVVNFIKKYTGSFFLDVMSCSWGTVVLTKFLSLDISQSIRRAVFFAPIYNDDKAGSYWKSKYEAIPQVNGIKAGYVYINKYDFVSRWNEEIPLLEKNIWRSQSVLNSIIDNTINKSTSSGDSFIVPTGPLADLYDIFNGFQVHDSTEVNIPSLVVRGDHDLTSTFLSSKLFYDNISCCEKKYLTISDGSHFVILEEKFEDILCEVLNFLGK